MLESFSSCRPNLYGGPDNTPVGGYSQLLILPMRGKSLPPPTDRPAIRLPHSAPSSPPITILIARRKTIILRIAPDRPGLSASVPALPSETLVLLMLPVLRDSFRLPFLPASLFPAYSLRFPHPKPDEQNLQSYSVSRLAG